MMTCEPLRLFVDPNAKPVAVHKPTLVPIHWREKVYLDLERDVRLGVLEKVHPNTPVTWCSRMVITPKSDGTPRRTVDLQPQNRHAVRQTHHVSSPFHLAYRIPQNTVKTVTDAWNGYHSVPIHPDDRQFTTFITSWGGGGGDTDIKLPHRDSSPVEMAMTNVLMPSSQTSRQIEMRGRHMHVSSQH